MKRRTSLPTLVLIGVATLVVLVIVVASGGSAKSKTPSGPHAGLPAQAQSSAAPRAGNSAIGVRSTPLGKTLVDANGRTLYLFEADGPNVSRLPAAGLGAWPPFTAGRKPQATGGAIPAQIGTASGAGGKPQVTYNGHPLYYFAGDHNPGDTAGQGLNEFGALWYVLSPGGKAITGSSTPSSGGYSAPGGGY